MSYIIDRRQNTKGKNLGNRQRFLRRANEQIKKAVNDAIQNKNIKDINNGDKVKIPVKDLGEHSFGNDNRTGNREFVTPGNKKFIEGDTIDKPSGGGGGSGQGEASDSGEGEDDFSFSLTREEFLDFFFDDLELPNLLKKSLKEIKRMKNKRSGYSNYGSPTNMDIRQTMKKSMARRISLGRPKDEHIEELEKEYSDLESRSEKTEKNIKRMRFLEEEILKMKSRQFSVPWIDPVDVKFKNYSPIPFPTSQAVMFALMDVSGSMGEREKDLAKRFFMLLYLFLERQYEKIDIVFIRHTQDAKEVDEEEFFNSKESGGTVVSSGLELMEKIIHDRYPTDIWNIYCAQASDGDNFSSDSSKCNSLMHDKILPITQYYAYIEIVSNRYSSRDTELWEVYKTIKEKWKGVFEMKHISAPNDIYPVFKELFSKHKQK